MSGTRCSNNIFDSGLYSDTPPGADPEPFKHEANEYYNGLAAHILACTGHHPQWG